MQKNIENHRLKECLEIKEQRLINLNKMMSNYSFFIFLKLLHLFHYFAMGIFLFNHLNFLMFSFDILLCFIVRQKFIDQCVFLILAHITLMIVIQRRVLYNANLKRKMCYEKSRETIVLIIVITWKYLGKTFK